MSFKIRSYNINKASDFNACLYMYIDCLENYTYVGKKPYAEFVKDFIINLTAPDAVCLVLMNGKYRYAGMAIGHAITPEQYHCDVLYILEEFRGTKAFEYLYHAFAELIKKAGYKCITFDASIEKNKELFKKLSYNVKEEFTRFKLTF